MSDNFTRRLVAVSVLVIFFGGLLLALVFFGPEHPNATQQAALNTLLVFCGACGVELIKGVQNILFINRSPQRKQND